jgi:hypothetical protein
MHPLSAAGKEIAGSLYCANHACLFGGMFFNRDLSASLNIGCRYGHLLLLCGVWVCAAELVVWVFFACCSCHSRVSA